MSPDLGVARMGEANTVPEAILFPVAVAVFYVWQVVAWIAARGRWERHYAGWPVSKRPRQPRFMDGVTRGLGGLLLTGLPFLSGAALLFATLVFVAVPLAHAFGLLGGLSAGAVVFAGVSVLFGKALGRFHRQSRPGASHTP